MQAEGLPPALFQEVTKLCFDELGLCALLEGCLHYDADAITLAVKSSCWEKFVNLMATDNLEVVRFPYALGVTVQMAVATGFCSG